MVFAYAFIITSMCILAFHQEEEQDPIGKITLCERGKNGSFYARKSSSGKNSLNGNFRQRKYWSKNRDKSETAFFLVEGLNRRIK